MARSYRCSNCNVNWPAIKANVICKQCGIETWTNNGDAADDHEADNTETQELPLPSPAYTHRAERYLELGFSAVDAHQLASAKDRQGFFVYHGVVARCLAQGATLEQAVRVFA